MKKTLKILLLIVIVFICIDLCISFFKKSPEDTFIRQGENVSLLKSAEPINSTEYTNTIEKSTYTIQISGHDVTGLSSTLNKAVNEQVREKIFEIQEAFIADVSGVKLISEDQKHQLSIEAGQPVAVTDKTFYIEISVGSYYSGAAHPLSYKVVMNFITQSGELISLDSILSKNDPAPLKKISEVATVKVKKNLQSYLDSVKQTGDSGSEKQTVDDIFEPTGTAPTAENFSVFYVEDGFIRWAFSPYQVAPYVFGEMNVKIPFVEIAGSLADKSWLK